MLKTRIIPSLLLRGNSIVKSVQFKEPRMIGDAMTAVKVFSQRKADELLILDIDAYKNGIQFDLIERLASFAFMPLTIGGGISSMEDAKKIFQSGADKISLNQAFHINSDLIEELVAVFGSQAISISLDFCKTERGYISYYDNGSKESGSTLKQLIETAAKLEVGELLINSIDQDGLMNGFDNSLIQEVADQTKLPIIACGGCGNISHLSDAIDAGADAVSAGSIFHWVGESLLTIKRNLKDLGYNLR